MTSELFFRSAFSILLVIFFTIVIWVSYSTRGPLSERLRTQTTRRMRRFRIAVVAVTAIAFAGASLYVLLPSSVIFFSIALPDWLRVVMTAVAAMGIVFVSWAYRVLGKNFSLSVGGVRGDTVLVTIGPYGLVRHPVYLGASIFLGAITLVAANWLILIPTFAGLVLLHRSIDEEERLLIARFGDEYREYTKHTPRFIPKFRH